MHGQAGSGSVGSLSIESIEYGTDPYALSPGRSRSPVNEGALLDFNSPAAKVRRHSDLRGFCFVFVGTVRTRLQFAGVTKGLSLFGFLILFITCCAAASQWAHARGAAAG
jgi:hypothetical protein